MAAGTLETKQTRFCTAETGSAQRRLAAGEEIGENEDRESLRLASENWSASGTSALPVSAV